MYNAIVVANSILYKMGNLGKEVRPLKLQKLLYYTVGFYYKKCEKDLLCPIDNFYKWGYGPVEPDIYHYFEKYRYRPISKLHKDKQGNIYIVSFDDKDFYEILDKVIAFYGDKGDFVLSDMTNKHDTWLKTKDYDLITRDLMHETFKKLDYGE